MRITSLLAIAAAGIVLSLPAHAATVYNLTQQSCSSSCGTAPYGTVSLTQNGTGSSATVTVTLTLKAGEQFVKTGAGEALEFNVAGTVSITNVTSGFAAGVGGNSASGFGGFSHFVTCSSCQGGKPSNPDGPLTFTVGSTTGVTIASFTATNGYLFAADIQGTTGGTGNVAARTTDIVTTPTPEPGSMVMMFSSALLIGVGAARKRTARK